MPTITKKAKQPDRATQSASPLAPCWAPCSTLPKINSAKLTSENRVYIHPVCACADDTYEPTKGWRIAGWGNAPWASALGPHAIVYEKLTPAHSESIYASSHHYFEHGLYWGHGDATKMKFLLPNDGDVERRGQKTL